MRTYKIRVIFETNPTALEEKVNDFLAGQPVKVRDIKYSMIEEKCEPPSEHEEQHYFFFSAMIIYRLKRRFTFNIFKTSKN